MNDVALRPDGLDTRWLGRSLRVLDETDSTSLQLARWAEEGAPHGAVVVAGRQTGGRGRQGRTWNSPPGNLYVSWLLRPAPGANVGAALSVVVGVTVAAALREGLGLERVGLKWPNDVWLDGRKVAGVLLETRSGARCTIVVGLGLNLVTPAGGWDEELRRRATALDAHGVSVTPARALEILLPPIERATDLFLAEGLGPFLDGIRSASLLDGRRVRLERGDGVAFVQVLGVADDGGLVVRDERGVDAVVHAGEVHLGETSS